MAHPFLHKRKATGFRARFNTQFSETSWIIKKNHFGVIARIKAVQAKRRMIKMMDCLINFDSMASPFEKQQRIKINDTIWRIFLKSNIITVEL